MKGTLKRTVDNKVNSTGKSYDQQMYTFKEMDYKKDWVDLAILVKETQLLDQPSASSDVENNDINVKVEKEKVDDKLDPIEELYSTPSSRLNQGCLTRMIC